VGAEGGHSLVCCVVPIGGAWGGRRGWPARYLTQRAGTGACAPRCAAEIEEEKERKLARPRRLMKECSLPKSPSPPNHAYHNGRC
jgi:hypothetical protein